ncbi:MAG TPA: tRNA (adenosine(37)-N6)-dimethylallyltransferase MiaA [Acidimicrobiales bacterium]|nr:tRNA (adenosine(37)-N6)-dimethylallyltransferase MiaA [Acidimicrobiales bacterium]
MQPYKHVVLVGPTGSGKSALALDIARHNGDFEIVSVDAMCVYHGMDVGTAKPTPTERQEVPHHLIDIVEPSDDYSLARFQADCRAAVDDIDGRGKRALLVGGTGLYVRAAVDGLDVPPRFPELRAVIEDEQDTGALYERLRQADPRAATKMLPNNRRRIVRALEVCEGSGRTFSSFGPGLDAYPPTAFRLIGLWPPRAALAARLEARFAAMLESGFVQEVRALARRPGGLGRTARQALGYRQLLEHVEDGRTLDACVAEAVRATVQFARRQRVWFRRDPRIAWYPSDVEPAAMRGAPDW